MDWVVSEHPVVRQILSTLWSDDSLTTSLAQASSELWAITLAACQVNPNKNRQKAETICCLSSWPLLKYFCSPRVQHWHIFERRMANVIFESWLWTQCSCKCPDCDLKQKSRWDLCLDTAGQYPEHYTFHLVPVARLWRAQPVWAPVQQYIVH